jgi:hypothetical protein
MSDSLSQAQGQAIADCSYVGKGNTQLNTTAVKAKVAALWGNIELTVIGADVRMMLLFFEKAKAAAIAVDEPEVL